MSRLSFSRSHSRETPRAPTTRLLLLYLTNSTFFDLDWFPYKNKPSPLVENNVILHLYVSAPTLEKRQGLRPPSAVSHKFFDWCCFNTKSNPEPISTLLASVFVQSQRESFLDWLPYKSKPSPLPNKFAFSK